MVCIHIYVYFRGFCAVELELAVCEKFLTIRVRSIRHISRVYHISHTCFWQLAVFRMHVRFTECRIRTYSTIFSQRNKEYDFSIELNWYS